MKTEVMERGPAHFDMCGQFKGYPLKNTSKRIPKQIVEDLLRYGTERAQDAGLTSMLGAWEVDIYTMDGDERPKNRGYNVRWTNPEGTVIELCYILLSGKDGKPFIDHGFSLSQK